MSVSNLSVLLIVFGLCACHGNSDSSVQPNGDFFPPPKENNADVASDYVETAELNLVHTNQLLNEIKSNTVTIKGTGSKSTYKIIYSFNSGTSQSFAVSETEKTITCASGQTEMLLKSKSGSREVYLVNSYDLTLNTDYTLEVKIPNSCKEFYATFNLIAWVGDSAVKPHRTLVCESNQLGQTYFFPYINVMSVFTSVISKEKFIDLNIFCGEAFKASRVTCSQSGTGLLNIGLSLPGATCTAEEGLEKRIFNVSFDFEKKSALVTCSNTDEITFTGNFNSCEIKMLDYNQFKKF